jgi:hypothetical protein
VTPAFFMEYQYEHIEVDAPDDEWLEDVARLLAEIIYAQMVQKVNDDEQIPDLVQPENSDK